MNDPHMTLKRFVPNPFNMNDAEKLYKTGDIARYLPDGNLEFLGRMDNQVKIRGYRIELEEIERILEQYPDIEMAIVIVHQKDGNPLLVSYYTSRNKKAFEESQLRTYLSQKLPSYMIPSVFICLDEMPRNANGKVDRNKLALQKIESITALEPRKVSKNGLEDTLFKMWSRYLNIDVNSIDENESFQNLGGNSLLFLKMLMEVQKTFKINSFSMENNLFEEFLQKPTIKKLCLIITLVQEKLSTPI